MPINNNLLPSENLILASDDNALILTTKRVKYEVISRSKSVYKSIPIDKVSTCALDTHSLPILLVLAIAAVLAIFVAPDSGQRIGAGIFAVVLVLAYFGTRNGQIAISSDGGESIVVPTKGLSHDQVKKFLEAVAFQYEEARAEQRKQISRVAA